MFTWICPKCGKEVPPSYSECPNCAANEQTPPEAAPQPEVQPEPPSSAAPSPPAIAAAPPRVRPGAVAVPYWLLIIIFAAAFVGLGFGIVLWQQQKHAQADVAATPAVKLQPPTTPFVQTSPEFRDVELTGLRLTEDAKKKPFVQFVVVNHSAADLGDIAGTVNLKAVAKQDQEPVGAFSFKTKLGPYESKDLKEPLETKLRVYELPDWQFLRAEVAAK